MILLLISLAFAPFSLPGSKLISAAGGANLLTYIRPEALDQQKSREVTFGNYLVKLEKDQPAGRGATQAKGAKVTENGEERLEIPEDFGLLVVEQNFDAVGLTIPFQKDGKSFPLLSHLVHKTNIETVCHSKMLAKKFPLKPLKVKLKCDSAGAKAQCAKLYEEYTSLLPVHGKAAFDLIAKLEGMSRSAEEAEYDNQMNEQAAYLAKQGCLPKLY